MLPALISVAGTLSRCVHPLSDLAYADMFYYLLLAISAHLHAGDGGFAPALVGWAAVITSFLPHNAARTNKSPILA
jgi:hypothetical protein